MKIMKVKKIALVGNANCSHLYTWDNALHEAGFETDIFSPVKSSYCFKGSFHAPRRDSRFDILYYIRLAKILRRYEYVNVQMPIFKGILLFLLPRRKVTVSILGTEVLLLPKRYPLYRFLLSKMLERARHVLVPNVFLKERTEALSAGRIHSEIVIYGVDMSRFTFRKKGIQGRTKILLPKDIKSVYGIDIMLKAFRLLQEGGFDGELVITGSRKLPEEWKKLAESCPDPGRISFPGWVTDIEDYFAKAHITVLPSRSESFGVAAIESIASGTPVIASRIGGLVNIVGESKGGILIEPENPEEVRRAVLEISGRYPQWSERMESASEHVRSVYSIEEQIRQIKALWERY